MDIHTSGCLCVDNITVSELFCLLRMFDDVWKKTDTNRHVGKLKYPIIR